MRRIILYSGVTAALLFGYWNAEAAPPSRTQTYTAGEVINPSDVTENEDNIYTYLQNGVDRIADNSVETADIQNSAVTTSKINTGAVTSSSISDGTIVNADVNASAEIGYSKLKTMSGDATITDAGALTIAADSVALTTDTTGNYVKTLADAGNSTVTVTNGSAEGGAATVDAVDVNCSNCIDGTDIALGSDAQGDVMYYDGTDWARLGAGTDGTFLETNGAAADPTWSSIPGSAIFASTYDVPGNGTYYTMYNTTSATDEDTISIVMPYAGTISNLRADVENVINCTITIVLNGTDENGAGDPKLTYAAESGAKVDSTNTLAVSAGGTVSIKMTPNSAGVIKVSFEYTE